MKKQRIAAEMALTLACALVLAGGCSPENVTQIETLTVEVEEDSKLDGRHGDANDASKPDADSLEGDAYEGFFPVEYGGKIPELFEVTHQPETEEELTAKAAEQIRAFAAESSKLLYPKEKTKNFLYSPAGFYMGLELCGSITAKDSAQDLMSLLGVSDRAELLREGNALIRGLSSEEEGAVLKIGNSIWADRELIPMINTKGYSLIEQGARALGADAYYTDLQAKETKDEIDSWISRRTEGLIDQMPIPITEDTAMTLFNTLYFDKKWARPVSDNEVVRASFYPYGTKGISGIDRIDYTLDDHHYVKTAHATSSAAEYQDGSYVIFIKPDSDAVLDAVMTEDLGEVIEAYAKNSFTNPEEHNRVMFGIPLIDFKDKHENLRETLFDLGVNSLQEPGAFSDIDPQLYVAKIAQDCRLIMDREGTKAAAVTEFEMRLGAVRDDNRTDIDMRLDHAYGFVIMSEDDIPLFIGTVKDPG